MKKSYILSIIACLLLAVSNVSAQIPVTGVTVSPSTLTVVAGAYKPLTATVAPANATNATVTWSSSNSAVARVSVSGVVTGMAVGSATITATTQDGSFTSSSAVTISAPAANYVNNPGFEANTAPSATATNWYEWGSYTANGNVVTGNSLLGDAIGGTPHSGTNYFAFAGAGTYGVNMKQDFSGLPNGTYTLKFWCRGSNASGGYHDIKGNYSGWGTLPSVWTQKTVTSINVTTGAITFNIIYNTTTGGSLNIDDVELTLNQMVLVTGINAVSPATKTLSLNETATLTTTTIPANASNSTINWTSSNTSVATVSATGVVTAVSGGTATITATTAEGGFTSSSVITVLANYVKNPGFEGNGAPATSATSWSEWSGTAAYQNNSNVITGNVGLGDVVGGAPHSGSYYVQVGPTVANPTTYGLLNYQSVTLPNGTYTLTGWFRGNGGSGYFNVGGTYNNFNFANLAQWTKLTIGNVVITTGSCQINIDYTATTGQKLDIDDIQLRPADITISGAQTSTALTNVNANIIVPATAELTIDAPRTVQSVTLNPGAKLTISAGQTFTATNGITLESTAGGGTATFVDETAGSGQTITGSVQQYLATTRNWYVSSPVSNAVAPAGYTYYRRNEPAVSWTAVSAGAGLTAGLGYIALPNSAGPITFTTQSGGKLNTGTITIPLTWQGASNKGYNLIGNPYPSHLTWNKAFTDANAAKIEPSIWYRTNSGGSNSSGWSFKTYNAFTGVGVPEGTTGIIPPMQAFWVLAKVDGQSIQFTNSMRSHQTSNPLKVPAAQKSENKIMRLQVSNGTASDETVLLFNANAMDSYDIYDSPKMLNNDSNVPDIFTVIDTKKIVINGMSEVKYNVEIPIGFSTATANDFSISTTELSNFESGTRIILKDKLRPNAEIDLTDGQVYNFSSTATAPATDRFSLQFRAPGVSTGFDNSNKLNTQVFVNTANQITIITPEKCNYAVYNTIGKLIENGQTTAKLQTVKSKLQTGMYVVKVDNQSTRVIIK